MSVASAQLYVAGGMGQASLKLDCAGAPVCDKTDTGGKVHVGYQITPALALEGTYFNFGKATLKGPGGSFAQVQRDWCGRGGPCRGV
ncbi:hypothetical protein [uncultured Aquabacterium sp.]|uniref:hypothetical protein n=1 Tax=uncultured Aquabacterium sp. TaxID=158753 RepID=UPI0030D5BB6C